MQVLKYYFLYFVICFSILVLGFIPSALALKLPKEVKNSMVKILPVARVRIDGAIETQNGDLYLPLIPVRNIPGNKNESVLKEAFPNKTKPDLILLDNGWCFIRVVKIDEMQTVISLDKLTQEMQKSVLATRLASDLIVPKNLVLPLSMKPIVGSVVVAVKDILPGKSDAQAASKSKNEQVARFVSGHGDACLIVISPATGKISLLTYPALEKKIEFPIDGTPSGVAYARGKVYISDQSKSRVLILDPYRRLFLGQIDLPKGSTPKDVVALADGKLIYVSENMFNDVAVFETEADKLLVRTKVNSYPGRMALSTNGGELLILSVPDSKVSMISTQNQRFTGTIAVGSLPSGVAINADSKTAYISNRVSDTVSVIDLAKRAVIVTLKTGIGPTGITVDSDNKKLYVANAKDNSITVFDLISYKKISDIKLPLDLDFPNSLTLLPDKKHILVTSAATDSIGLFDILSQTFDKITSIGHNSDRCLWVPAN